MAFFRELQRRNVFKVATAYAVVAWLLVQVVVSVLPTFDAPRWITQTLVFLLILGFPIAVLLAWAYELTPRGIAPDPATGPRPAAAQLLSYGVVALLTVIAAFVIINRYYFQAAESPAVANDSAGPRVLPERASPSVAVLPFEDLSEGGDQEYFSSGISEELLNVLAEIAGLRVPSRTSSFSFKGTGTDLRTIAAALNVTHVLEGSVRKAGNQIRVSAQLIEAGTDTLLWRDSYTRELVDIFQIQDEIAASVADALRVELLGEGTAVAMGRRTASIEAYEAYLHGLLRLARRRTEDLAAAREYFREASTQDPSYASAYAGLADSYVLQHLFGALSRDELQANMGPAIASALDLDPGFTQAITARALYAYLTGDLAAAEADFRRVIEQSPNNAQAHLWFSLVLRAAWKDPQRPRALLEAALESDPRAPIIISQIEQLYGFVGDFERASEYHALLQEIAPSFPIAYIVRAWIEAATGSDVAAHELHQRSVALDRGNPFLTLALAVSSLGAGDLARSQQWLDEAADLMPDESAATLARNFIPLIVLREDPPRLTALLERVNPNFFIWTDFRTFAAATMDETHLAAVRNVYARMFPELLDGREIAVNALNVHAAVDVAWILRTQGDPAGANALLERSLEVMGGGRGVFAELHLAEARALAMLERDVEALERLRRAAGTTRGYYWWLAERDPTLASIRDQPEFAALVERGKSTAAARFEAASGLRD